MPDQHTIEQELERLSQYRRELAHYLKQRAMLGASVTFEVVDGIRHTREQIQQIKARL